MLNKYILGDKVIEATEERYNRSFKDIGYIPYVEKKVVEEKTTEKKKTNKDK